jgi:hypothetical protein
MKQLFLLLVIGYSVTTHAAILTVSNNPSSLAQYSNIGAAIAAAASGDTIYVHGSPNSYGDVRIANKRIALIGPGYSPLGQLAGTAIVTSVALLNELNNFAASGSEIQGLVIRGGVYIGIDNDRCNAVNDVKVIRNAFISGSADGTILYTSTGGNFSLTASGLLFESNYFENTQVIFETNNARNFVNFLFHNNVFYSSLASAGVTSLRLATSVRFDHNVFCGPLMADNKKCFVNDCRNLFLSNNVFINRNPALNLSTSQFSNNITFNAETNNPWAVNNNIDGGGNIENQNPQLASEAALEGGSTNPLLDYSIAAGPANNSASDGRDMGLIFDPFGGLNWTESRKNKLPYIFLMNIANITAPAGGTLNVQLEARKAN